MITYSKSCAIQQKDFVVITGGIDWGSRNQVSEYDVQGWVRDLPKLQQGRYGHGCGHYLNDNNDMVTNIDNELLNYKKVILMTLPL